MLKADGGEVFVMGHSVSEDPDSVRKIIGLTGQSASLDELLTGRENLIMMGQIYRLTKESATARTEELLQDFDLVEASKRPVKTYSGGMRRRLDLAVSLIAKPPVIFLDEPTTGLDPRSRLVMWEIISKLKKQGTTILLTTQYLEEADQLADNIVLIDGGKIVAEGTAKELKSKVGKNRLIIAFEADDIYQKAQEVLKDINIIKSDSDRTIAVLVDNDNSDVLKVLELLAKHNLPILTLDLHKPTLDDVFLTLTKHKG